MLAWICLFEAALLGWAASAPTSGSAFALFETHLAPSTFTKLSTPPPQTQRLTLRIGLKQPHSHQLDGHALAISDPSHPRYGQFLDDAQIAELNAPDGESVDVVTDWLASHGLVGKWSSNQEWVVVSEVPLPKVEGMLDARYALYQHASGDVLVRTEAWSLPSHLHRHVDLIQVRVRLD